MPWSCETYIGFLPNVVDGSLGPRDAAEARAHRERCGRCAEATRDLSALRDDVRSALSPAPLPASFTLRVMTRVRALEPLAPPRRLSRAGAGALLVLAAALALAVASGFLAGPERALLETGGASLIARADGGWRVARAGDALEDGDLLLTLPGESARIDLGGRRTIDAAPLAAVRFLDRDEVALEEGEILARSRDRTLRVRAGDSTCILISGAEGSLRTGAARPQGGDYHLRRSSSVLADQRFRDPAARVEITSRAGVLLIERTPDRVPEPPPFEAPSPPTSSRGALELPAGRSYVSLPAPSALGDPSYSVRDAALPRSPLRPAEPPRSSGLASVLDGRAGFAGIRDALAGALDGPRAVEAAQAIAFLSPGDAEKSLAPALAARRAAGDAETVLALVAALAGLPNGGAALADSAAWALARLEASASADDLPPPRPLSAPDELDAASLAAEDLRRTIERDALPLDAGVVAVAGSRLEDAARESLRRYLVRAGLRSAGLLRDPAHAPAAAAVLLDDEESPGIRAEAAYALGRIGAPRATPFLVAALENDATPAAVRSAAAFALAAGEDPTAIPVLVDSLARGRSDAERRLAAVALGRHRGDAASGAILHAVAEDPGEDETISSAALRSLGERGETDAVGLIERALGDPRDGYRAAAIDAAERNPDPSYLPVIGARLSEEPDESLRPALMRVVRSIGGPAAAGTVRRGLVDSDAAVRAEAISAAVAVATREVEADLVSALRSSAVETGADALVPNLLAALVSIAPRSHAPDALVESILPHLASADPWARAAAARAIGRSRSSAARGAIVPLLEDPDESVAVAAAEGLLLLSERTGYDHLAPLAEGAAEAGRRIRALEAIDAGVLPGGPLSADAFSLALRILSTDTFGRDPRETFLALLVADKAAGPEARDAAYAAASGRTSSSDPWIRWAAFTALARRGGADAARLREFLAGDEAPRRLEPPVLRDTAAPGRLSADEELVAASRRALAERPLGSDAPSDPGRAGALAAADVAGLRDGLDRIERRRTLLDESLRTLLRSAPDGATRERAARWLALVASADGEAALRDARENDPSPAVREAAAAASEKNDEAPGRVLLAARDLALRLATLGGAGGTPALTSSK